MRIRCLCRLHFDLNENKVYIDFLTLSAVYIVMPVACHKWLFCEWVGKSFNQTIRLKKLIYSEAKQMTNEIKKLLND